MTSGHIGALQPTSGCFYAEGLRDEWGGHLTTVGMTYIPIYALGPYSDPRLQLYTVRDAVEVHVCDPEINLHDLPDCEEFTAGGYVPLNDDDDDGSPGVDVNELGPVLYDNDLIPLEILYKGAIPEGYSTQLTLSVVSGGDKIRFWSDTHKTEEMYPGTFHIDIYGTGLYGIYGLRKPLPDKGYYTTIYVEGIATSALNEVVLQVAYQPRESENLTYVDKLKFSVVNVTILSPTEDRAVMISTNPDVEVGDRVLPVSRVLDKPGAHGVIVYVTELLFEERLRVHLLGVALVTKCGYDRSCTRKR